MKKKFATGENSKKNNAFRMSLANAINQKANVFSAILAIIIIVMWACLMNPEAYQYEDVLNLRSQMGCRVGTNQIANDEILASHEQCLKGLEILKETSRLGAFIVKCDQNIGGRIINWLIVYGMRIFVILLTCHVVLQLVRFANGKIRQCKENKKKPLGQ